MLVEVEVSRSIFIVILCENKRFWFHNIFFFFICLKLLKLLCNKRITIKLKYICLVFQQNIVK